jgi:hypothetical protein
LRPIDNQRKINHQLKNGRLILKGNLAQRSSADGIRDGIVERSTSAKADTVNQIFRADGIRVREVVRNHRRWHLFHLSKHVDFKTAD